MQFTSLLFLRIEEEDRASEREETRVGAWRRSSKEKHNFFGFFFGIKKLDPAAPLFLFPPLFSPSALTPPPSLPPNPPRPQDVDKTDYEKDGIQPPAGMEVRKFEH